ncbi:hypothetical protein [Desulfoscipio gibsoniae]
MFASLTQKLNGEQIENLVVGLHDARQMLHDALDAVKRYEVLVAGQVASERKGTNEDIRKAEVAGRLERDGEYQSLNKKLQDARVNLTLAEAELEREKAGHAGLVAMTGLVTAMVNAGQIKDQNKLENVIVEMLRAKKQDSQLVKSNRGPSNNEHYEQATQSPAQTAAKDNAGVETGAFMVLEVRDTRNGAKRGYCQDAKGNKVAIYATNGLRQTMAQAEGCFIHVTYCHGDKGLIAKSIKIVS